MSISYSDGTKEEQTVLRLLKEASDLSSLSPIAADHYGDWSTQYHLTPTRANLVRHLNFTGLRVLEIGAGMGGVSRFLAEQAQELVVIEGTKSRFDCLSERLRDLFNWSGQVANFQDVELKEPFDVVCIFGVLEYAELYISPGNGKCPFEWMIDRAFEHLSSDGVLILSIENKLGLKYFAGGVEDHRGTLFDGICGYPSAKSARTFSRKELQQLFSGVGAETLREYFPFPDYKTPKSVLTHEMISSFPHQAAQIATSSSFWNQPLPHFDLFSQTLSCLEVAKAGLLADLANSFLTLATKNKDSKVLGTLTMKEREKNALAWSYSSFRKEPIQSTFALNGETVSVTKHPLKNAPPKREGEHLALTWNALSEPLLTQGEMLTTGLEREAYFAHWEGFLELFDSFFSWVKATYQLSPQADTLEAHCVDLLISNTISSSEGFAAFDLEWSAEGGIPLHWLIFRNALMANMALSLSTNTFFNTPEELYLLLCKRAGVRAHREEALSYEVELQSLLTLQQTENIRSNITRILREPLAPSPLPREAQREVQVRKFLPFAYSPLLRRAADLEKAVQGSTTLSTIRAGIRRLLR